jgi:integral membrane protein
MTRTFKIVALLEGISLLLLLFFAMPMKYIFDDPIFVKNIGMAHGLLFIAYILLAIIIKEEKDWNWKTFGIICLASIIPFGTFYVESKYLKNA